MLSPVLRQIILLSLVVLAFSRRSDIRNHEDRVEKDTSKWLSDTIESIPWRLRSFLYIVYLIVNTVVNTLTQITAMVVGLFQQTINLIEFVGYCVRVVLQTNYNFVSSCISSIWHFGENCYNFSKDLIVSTIATLASLMDMILRVLHNMVFNIPKVYEVGADSTAKIAGVFADGTNSTFRSAMTMTAAIVELFGRSVMNTSKLFTDLILNCLWSCVRLFQFIGRTIIHFVVKVGYGGILCLESLWRGIQYISLSTFGYITEIVNKVQWITQVVIMKIYDGLLVIFQSIGLFVRHCILLLWNGFKYVITGLHGTVNVVTRNLKQIGYQLIVSSQGSKLTLISVSSAFLMLCSLWFVCKMNLFMLAFGFLETGIQHIAMQLIRIAHGEQNADENEKMEDEIPVHSDITSLDGNVETLRQQLARERDKSLCVVCQDHVKKVLLLPCRHMCICVICANHLTRFTHLNRRICPLCRTRIGSTVEVYS